MPSAIGAWLERSTRPADPGGGEALEDDQVLGHRDPRGGGVERVEVDIGGAAVEVAQLVAGHRERSSQLDELEHAALAGLDALDGLALEVADAAEAGGGMLPAGRAGEVDEPAGREGRQEALAGLLVDGAPARLGDRGVGAE